MKIPPERLAEVERRLLAAELPARFVPALAREWKITKRQVWNYVARVRARLAAAVKGRDPDEIRQVVEAMLVEAFETARLGGEHGPDAKGMVAAAKTYAELHGVLAPKRIEHSGAIGTPNYDDLRRRLEAVVAGDGAALDAPAVGALEPGGPEGAG